MQVGVAIGEGEQRARDEPEQSLPLMFAEGGWCFTPPLEQTPCGLLFVRVWQRLSDLLRIATGREKKHEGGAEP